MHQLGSTLRILRPVPGILGFYDGRIAGLRAHSAAPNWLDDGAFSLGVCSYAIVDGAEALVYDTHISIAHAAIVRRTLEDMGVRHIRVVLSHWHADHVAGNAVFADCEIVANRLTDAMLRERRASLETRDPRIRPLVLPNRLFERQLTLTVGAVAVELRQIDIHSHDGTVLFLPGSGLLLAGDTLEDPVTYVAEPARLRHHLAELHRLDTWPITRILPSHGAERTIAAGGYGRGLIAASLLYVEKLERCRTVPDLRDPDLRAFAADAFATGGIEYFDGYEAVHRANLAAVAAA